MLLLVRDGAYDKPLLALLHACIKKRSYGYLDVFYALMEKDYDKYFKWKVFDNFKAGKTFSHIRSLGAAGALAVDICICFQDIES